MLPAQPTVPYRLERDGAEIDIEGPFPFPPMVDGVQPNSAAMDVGIAPGDVIVAVDGRPVWAFMELREIVGASDGKPVLLTVWRDGTTFDAALVPRRMDLPNSEGGFETRWLIGLTGGLVFSPQTRTPGPVEAFKLGAAQTWNVITTSLSGLSHMISGAISSCNLQRADRHRRNLGRGGQPRPGQLHLVHRGAVDRGRVAEPLSVPILDGGHLVFHAYEAVAGRPPSDRALRLLMGLGLALIGSLMVFALTNDLFCP